MKPITPHADVVDTLSLQDLCRFCGESQDWVMELVEFGVIEPVGTRTQDWQFHSVHISRAKKAHRLHRDLGINTAGVAMVLDLLHERDQILRRLSRYEGL
jgi:chaperone modulatory protein CbpM